MCREGVMDGRRRQHAARQVSFITACLMAVALCFHSLLEGAALGAQQDVAESLHIFIAILAHKVRLAFSDEYPPTHTRARTHARTMKLTRAGMQGDLAPDSSVAVPMLCAGF